MKFLRLVAALALLSPALPAFGQSSQAKTDFVNDIENWRVAESPRAAQLAALDKIRAEVQEAGADSDLIKPRAEFETWKSELLHQKFASSRAQVSFARYSAEQAQQVAFASRLHALISQAAARRVVENRQRSASAAAQNPSSFFDGTGERRAGPASVSASSPADADSPARYSKVRQILASQGASPRVVDMAIKEAIRQHADPLMVLAVINQESGFNVHATSYRRHRDGSFMLDEYGNRIPIAHGLMQLTSDKGRNLYDVQTNLRLGVAYLKQMWSRFVGEEMTAVAGVNAYLSHGVTSAVAAYNAGPGAVHKYSGVPPYRETQGYVKRVLGYYSRFQQYTDA